MQDFHSSLPHSLDDCLGTWIPTSLRPRRANPATSLRLLPQGDQDLHLPPSIEHAVANQSIARTEVGGQGAEAGPSGASQLKPAELKGVSPPGHVTTNTQPGQQPCPNPRGCFRCSRLIELPGIVHMAKTSA